MNEMKNLKKLYHQDAKSRSITKKFNFCLRQKNFPLSVLVSLWLILSFVSRAFSLTLDEAVETALKNNKNLKAQYESVMAETAELYAVKRNFDWEWFASYAASRAESPTTSQLQGALGKATDEQMGSSLGVKKFYSSGSSLKLQFDVTRQKTNSSFSLLNPNTSSGLQLQYVMPLIKNSGGAALLPVKLQRNTFELEKLQMLQSVSALVYQVQTAFLDVVYAKENLALQQDELKIAETFLQDTQARIKAGLLAPSEVFSAQARLAAAQKNVTSAESAYESAKDLLNTYLSGAEAGPVAFSFAGANDVFHEDEQVGMALKNRAEVLEAETQIARAGLVLFQTKNDAKLPLDMTLSLETSGKNKTFGESLSQTTGADFFSWQLGVTLSQPFGNKKARWTVEASKNLLEGSALKLEQLKLDIALEVRDALRQYETARKTYEQAVAQENYQKQVAETEEQKLKAGLSTSFLVQQANKDYLTAKTATLQAKTAIYKALFLIEKVTGSRLLAYRKVFE